jgi:hypothetical protein
MFKALKMTNAPPKVNLLWGVENGEVRVVS